MREIEIDRLSVIIAELNDLFGGIDWQDADPVHKMITETIPAIVAEDTAFRNARRRAVDGRSRRARRTAYGWRSVARRDILHTRAFTSPKFLSEPALSK